MNESLEALESEADGLWETRIQLGVASYMIQITWLAIWVCVSSKHVEMCSGVATPGPARAWARVSRLVPVSAWAGVSESVSNNSSHVLVAARLEVGLNLYQSTWSWPAKREQYNVCLSVCLSVVCASLKMASSLILGLLSP